MHDEVKTYQRQGFGAALEPKAPYGLLIIDFVNGFADPAVFGGGNIPQAIASTVPLLATAREQGWPVAHSRRCRRPRRWVRSIATASPRPRAIR